MGQARWRRLVNIATRGRFMSSSGRNLSAKDAPLAELAAGYDMVIMKHCFPASDILEDVGMPDPSSERKSLENYRTIYRFLRAEFDKHPNTIFMVWTLPPLHRLATDSEKAARATEFSEWLKADFLAEDGSHPNIYVWDFRTIVMDANTNFLKREYEVNHEKADSHPNRRANNDAGPEFARFIVDSIADFGGVAGRRAKIIFLHHSTGRNVYKYRDLGVPAWIDKYNVSEGTDYQISDIEWYPTQGNMPVHYYRSWLADQRRS